MPVLNPAIRRLLALPTRLLIVVVVSAAIILIPSFLLLQSSFDTPTEHNSLWAKGSVGHSDAAAELGVVVGGEEQDEFTGPEAEMNRKVAELVLHGGVIMGKLKNETLKAEIGRNTWKLLHTMAARFPLEPTESERETFKSFIYLFSRLYPDDPVTPIVENTLPQKALAREGKQPKRKKVVIAPDDGRERDPQTGQELMVHRISPCRHLSRASTIGNIDAHTYRLHDSRPTPADIAREEHELERRELEGALMEGALMEEEAVTVYRGGGDYKVRVIPGFGALEIGARDVGDYA
ncbi:hypothetical protein P7C70_g396, partial [Phenoliferia sp. Uapishka_3]